MGKIACLVAILLLLCGCTQYREAFVYRELAVIEGITTATDGEYVYQDFNKESKTLLRDSSPSFALYLIPNPEEGVHLTHTHLNSYTGTLYDLSNYIQLLQVNGFDQTHYSATSSYIDINLSQGDQRLRAIYFAEGTIMLFFQDGTTVGSPPYLR